MFTIVFSLTREPFYYPFKYKLTVASKIRMGIVRIYALQK